MVGEAYRKLQRVLQHIYKGQVRWTEQEDIHDYICNEISSALGNDLFAVLDSEFLFPLLMDWKNASNDDEKQKRSVFLAEFNLALDRAIKRKQLSN